VRSHEGQKGTLKNQDKGWSFCEARPVPLLVRAARRIVFASTCWGRGEKGRFAGKELDPPRVPSVPMGLV